MNILITSAGRRVSLVRAFQKELKYINPEAEVYAADSNPLLAAACHVSDGNFQVPRLDDPQYIDRLIELSRSKQIKLIIPTIDTELLLLAKHKERFTKNGITPLICSADFVLQCRDKRLIHKFFEEKGIRVAKEYPKNNFPLPLFIKPSNGSRSIDTYLIKHKEELKEFHFTDEKFMFLEYLDHQNFDEYTCDLYYGKDHELKCAVPRKRLEIRDGEVSKGLTMHNALVPFIKEHLSSIEGAVGCLTVQFFMDDQQIPNIYGIEINPRFGGGFPLSYLAGANFPKWVIQEYLLGQTIDPQFNIWEDRLLMLRYDDEILVHGYQS